MIWWIYSFFSMSLSSWEWEYWWDAGFWITSASPSRTNPCLMPIEAELSLGGGPLLQESFKANDGQENSRISIHIPVASLEKALSSFSSPGLKKTGMYPSLRTQGWLLGCHLGKTKNISLVWVRGISKESWTNTQVEIWRLSYTVAIIFIALKKWETQVFCH